MTTINKPRDVEEQETPEIALPDVYQVGILDNHTGFSCQWNLKPVEEKPSAW